MEATYYFSHFSRKLYEIAKKDLVTFHVLLLGHKMISLITKSADWLPNHKQPDLSNVCVMKIYTAFCSKAFVCPFVFSATRNHTYYDKHGYITCMLQSLFVSLKIITCLIKSFPKESQEFHFR